MYIKKMIVLHKVLINKCTKNSPWDLGSSLARESDQGVDKNRRYEIELVFVALHAADMNTKEVVEDTVYIVLMFDVHLGPNGIAVAGQGWDSSTDARFCILSHLSQIARREDFRAL